MSYIVLFCCGRGGDKVGVVLGEWGGDKNSWWSLRLGFKRMNIIYCSDVAF